MESVNDVGYEQRAVLEFLVAEKESATNIHKRLSNVFVSATVDRNTVGRWVKRATASKTEKQSFMICFVQAALSQLLYHRRCNVLMPQFATIDASQTDNWRSVFQSAKEMFMTSSMISDIRRYVRDGFLGSSQSNTKPREKPFLPFTLQPRSITLRFPPVWSPEGCCPRFEI
jgi:hypothetical protein